MAWYDLDDKEESKINNLQRAKYDEIICKKTKTLVDAIGDNLLPNVQYRIVTELAINALVVIEYLLKKHEIEEIHIAIYRMNIMAVNVLKDIIDKGNIKCHILLSSFFRENKKYERWCADLISYATLKDNVEIAFACNHAKVFLAKTKDDRFIVFEGSGNLSDNARIEQYLIEDNKNVYEFHRQWIDEIIKKGK